jgi:hypothetical protein
MMRQAELVYKIDAKEPHISFLGGKKDKVQVENEVLQGQRVTHHIV